MLNHPVFKGIIAEEPLPISNAELLESGVQAVWVEADCETAIRKEKCYIAGVNFWFQNIFWTPTPNVPLSKTRCLEYASFNYKTPRHLDPIHIAVTSMDEVQALKASAGNWRRISPEEPVHSLIFHLERIIQEGDADIAFVK